MTAHLYFRNHGTRPQWMQILERANAVAYDALYFDFFGCVFRIEFANAMRFRRGAR